MGRKRIIRSLILNLAALSACAGPLVDRECDIKIGFSCGETECRSLLPEENLLTDISLIVFDEAGDAEDFIRLAGGDTECRVRMVTGREYTFCACANFGYPVYADHISELDEITYHMAYPDEYREGVPMYAMEKIFIDGKEDEIELHLKRLMAKISLRMDRSELDTDVSMYVRSARIGNCPRSVKVFRESRAEDEDDCFPAGFFLNGYDTDPLNRSVKESVSESVSLYMLENMQGYFGSEISSDKDKVFESDDSRRQTCSYIELDLEYMSDRYVSGKKGLIYRFYLGEDRQNFDVERNSHYKITVTPVGDGLSDEGWRVDKSGLTETEPINFKAYPSEHIQGDIGDKIHIWCEFTPYDTPFDVGISYMQDDKAEGIYDYVLDDDGHGATLTLTGPGRGLIYMEAGDPVNDAALFIIEVNLP